MRLRRSRRIAGRCRRAAGFMTLNGGTVIDGTAFYDSIAFNELWDRVTR
jgi:hypothetical protein